MSRRRRRFDLPPRVLTAEEAASYLGKSLTWFTNHRAELEEKGFPKPLPTLGGYDRAMIDLWLNQQAGFEVLQPDYDAALMAASDGTV